MHGVVGKVLHGVGKVLHRVGKVLHWVREVLHGVGKVLHGALKVLHGRDGRYYRYRYRSPILWLPIPSIGIDGS